MNIGFIGLGRMGTGMAANLLKAGHDVAVYNRTAGKRQALVEKGARAGDEVADACRGEAVITMLADDGALESVAFGEKGLIGSLGRGAVHVCMATISVELSERLTALHAEAGQRFVAAPVFGRPDAAAAAKLFIVAAGEKETLDTCLPLFDSLGQKTFVIGDSPLMANLVKLSGNYLIAAEQYEPAGFAAPLGFKDMRLALAAAETLRVPMPLASLLRDRFLALLAQDGETLDWSAIGRLASRDAGQKSGHSCP